MKLVTGIDQLPVRLVHHTGSMVRLTTSQLPYMPTADQDCTLVLPDGKVVAGRFHRHPANPYIGGRELVGWIKSWIPARQTLDVYLEQVGTTLTGRISFDSAGQKFAPAIRRELRTLASQPRGKRRVAYERWERDPRLRPAVLSVWDARCQVVGCDSTSTSQIPAHLAGRLVDVHHLNHVGTGGTDSTLNLALLCVMHHHLIHRAPSTSLIESDLEHALVKVNGTHLAILRDGRSLMARLGS